MNVKRVAFWGTIGLLAAMLLASEPVMAASWGGGSSADINRLRRTIEKYRRESEQRNSKNKKKDPKAEAAKKKAARRKEMQKVTLSLLKELYKKAREAEKEENWSAAYRHYEDVSQSKLRQASKMVAQSKKKLLEIEKRVNRMLMDAILKEHQEDYTGAADIYATIIDGYPFLKRIFRRARQRLIAIERTPRSGAAIALAEADLLEKSSQYPLAARAYQKIIREFPEEVPALKARIRLKHFRRDPEISAMLKADEDAKAKQLCPRWLNLADNFLMNDQPERARVYLERVIEKYPSSVYAKTARKKLASLH